MFISHAKLFYFILGIFLLRENVQQSILHLVSIIFLHSFVLLIVHHQFLPFHFPFVSKTFPSLQSVLVPSIGSAFISFPSSSSSPHIQALLSLFISFCIPDFSLLFISFLFPTCSFFLYFYFYLQLLLSPFISSYPSSLFSLQPPPPPPPHLRPLLSPFISFLFPTSASSPHPAFLPAFLIRSLPLASQPRREARRAAEEQRPRKGLVQGCK